MRFVSSMDNLLLSAKDEKFPRFGLPRNT